MQLKWPQCPQEKGQHCCIGLRIVSGAVLQPPCNERLNSKRKHHSGTGPTELLPARWGEEASTEVPYTPEDQTIAVAAEKTFGP